MRTGRKQSKGKWKKIKKGILTERREVGVKEKQEEQREGKGRQVESKARENVNM